MLFLVLYSTIEYYCINNGAIEINKHLLLDGSAEDCSAHADGCFGPVVSSHEDGWFSPRRVRSTPKDGSAHDGLSPS